MIFARRLAHALGCILFLLAGSATTAAASDWSARLHGQWVASGGELFADEDLDDAFGLYLGAEYRFAERWGVEIGIAHSELESEHDMVLSIFGFVVDTEIETSVEITPITASTECASVSTGRSATPPGGSRAPSTIR